MRRRGIAALIFLSLGLTALAAGKAKFNSEATEQLMHAAGEGDDEGILAALAKGADPNAHNPDGTTPLMLAAARVRFGRERKVVEALVKAGAKVDAVDKEGATALMAAASAGSTGMVRLLLQNNAKVDLRDHDGWTALSYAVSGGDAGVVGELLEAKANVNGTTGKGWSPLMMALYDGRGAIAERLIKAGATMPTKAPNGLSALMLAIWGRDLSAVRQVLESGAALDEHDSQGWTALEGASFYGDGQIVMELLRAGADPSPKDNEGKTALDRAREAGHDEIVALLGGPWKKPQPKGKTSLTIPCSQLGGTVEANFAIDNGSLVVTTTFPKPLTWYLGGGSMNRAASAKKFVYDGSFTPAYYFDTDANPATGVKGSMLKEANGSEYSIDYSQYGTSVTLEYQDSKGNPQSKAVYANVLSVGVEKEGQPVDTSELGDASPRADNEGGVLVSRVPLSILPLPAGKPVRLTAKAGTCETVAKVKLR